MKTVLHRAATRGHVNFGWLDSHHTFSFGHYYDPERMNFGALRVLNDDVVSGGGGFPTHGHDNMEIISIPLRGDLKHQDSMGNQQVIRQGDVQIMSAGTGVRHSEYNHSAEDDVNFLQIWVIPKERNITPRYAQLHFEADQRRDRFQVVVSPEERPDAVQINQDATFLLGSLSSGSLTEYVPAAPNHGVYVFVLEGRVEVNGQALERRDGMGIWESDRLEVRAHQDSEVLLMDVPMQV